MLKRHFAAYTLATALLATTAMAQTSPAPSSQAPATAPSAAGPAVAPSTSGTMNTTSGASSSQFYTVMSGQQQWRASKFVGVDIYGANNEKIGDVNDIIIDDQGNINAVVIGVGGFLGIGEKDVAIPFRTVDWMMTDRNATARNASNSGAMGTNNAPNAANNGAMGTNNTAANNTAAGTNRPANSTDVTGTTVAGSTDNRGYPDHGVLRMTKQDLQNAPSFQYMDAANARSTGGAQNPVPTGTKP